MEPNELKVAIGQFLDLVVNGRGSERENIEALELALDMMAWIQHLIDPAFEKEYPPSPEQEPEAMRVLVAHQFPRLGPYRAPSSGVEPDAPDDELRDAVDDLTAIAHGLYDVAWRFQNTSDADAMWVFAQAYERHWRARLRNLQWYLEDNRDDAPA